MKAKSFVILLLLLLLLLQSGCGKNGSVSDTCTSGSRADIISTSTAPRVTESSTYNTQAITQVTDAKKQDETYLYPVNNDEDKWGYINSDGDIIIDFIYDHAGFFTDGIAVVNLNNRYGVIGLDGKTIIEPQYDYIGNYNEGMAHVVKQEANTIKHGFINKEGVAFFKDFLNNNTGDFHDGLAVFEKELYFGYVNTNGDIVIQPEYFMSYDFSEGLATVSNENDKHGFIDTTGKLVIPFQFDHNFDGTYLYEGFNNGLASVYTGEKFGYINKKGEFAIEPVFDYAGRFSDGVALVLVDGLYGYIDQNGEFVIEPQFAYASSFINGYAYVRAPGNKDYEQTGGYALINTTGDFITDENLIYEDGGGYTFIAEWNTGFIEELARVVMMVDGSPKFAYIKSNGKIVWER